MQTTLYIPNVNELRCLQVRGPSSQAPIGKPLTEEEALHLQKLLSKSDLTYIKIVDAHFGANNPDDSSWWVYFGIRCRDGTLPRSKKYGRIYQCLLCYNGGPHYFGSSESEALSRHVVCTLQDRGADISEMRHWDLPRFEQELAAYVPNALPRSCDRASLGITS